MPAKSKQTVTPTSAKEEFPAKTLLITANGDLTLAFAHVLKRIYQKFTNGTMTLSSEQLNAFSKACNDGKGFSEHELNEIHMYFDCDENKGLTLVCMEVTCWGNY